MCNITFTFPEETPTLREEICARWILYGYTEEKSANEESKFKVKFKEVTVQIGKYIVWNTLTEFVRINSLLFYLALISSRANFFA